MSELTNHELGDESVDDLLRDLERGDELRVSYELKNGATFDRVFRVSMSEYEVDRKLGTIDDDRRRDVTLEWIEDDDITLTLVSSGAMRAAGEVRHEWESARV